MSGDANLVLTDAEQATAPAAGATLATITLAAPSADVLPSTDTGRWKLEIDIHQEGTVDTANLANCALFVGATQVAKLLSPGNGNRHSQCIPVVYPQGVTTITVKAINTFAAASIVVVGIVAAREG